MQKINSFNMCAHTCTAHVCNVHVYSLVSQKSAHVLLVENLACSPKRGVGTFSSVYVFLLERVPTIANVEYIH